MDIQLLNIQHKQIDTTYTYRHDVEVMRLLRDINQVVKGKMQTKPKQSKKHLNILHNQIYAPLFWKANFNKTWRKITQRPGIEALTLNIQRGRKSSEKHKSNFLRSSFKKGHRLKVKTLKDFFFE